MWKPISLVVLALALEGAFILNAQVPDRAAFRRAALESRHASPDAAAARGGPGAISAGALARAR